MDARRGWRLGQRQFQGLATVLDGGWRWRAEPCRLGRCCRRRDPLVACVRGCFRRSCRHCRRTGLRARRVGSLKSRGSNMHRLWTGLLELQARSGRCRWRRSRRRRFGRRRDKCGVRLVRLRTRWRTGTRAAAQPGGRLQGPRRMRPARLRRRAVLRCAPRGRRLGRRCPSRLARCSRGCTCLLYRGGKRRFCAGSRRRPRRLHAALLRKRCRRSIARRLN